VTTSSTDSRRDRVPESGSDVSAETSEPALRACGLHKAYSGAVALAGVDCAFHAGRVHGILGENGAGKSTLIKILAGVTAPDRGTLELRGERVTFSDPIAAQHAGIGAVFQELSHVPDLTVAENIALAGATTLKRPFRRPRVLRQHVEELFERLHVHDIPCDRLISDLSLAQRQRVEIVKVVAKAPRVLILDEATSALQKADVEWLGAMVRQFAHAGVAVIAISHRLREIRDWCTEVTILRNGELVRTVALSDVDDSALVQDMLGRRPDRMFPKRRPQPLGEVVFDLEDFGPAESSHRTTLTLRQGEILGLGGLEGQGQAGLLMALAGGTASAGKLTVRDRPRRFRSPRDGLRDGVAFVPADRSGQGLLMTKSITTNIALGALAQHVRWRIVRPRDERNTAQRALEQFRIRAVSVDQVVGSLSGGNQQKVLLAKVLATGARVLLLHDPTRGVDVGTKAEIFQLMADLADDGFAFVFYSSDADELIHMCDRIAIMSRGEIVSMLPTAGLTESEVIGASVGGGTR
jgi:ribose transport system ATP-binding protein